MPMKGQLLMRRLIMTRLVPVGLAQTLAMLSCRLVVCAQRQGACG
jgi:hypothetical protein